MSGNSSTIWGYVPTPGTFIEYTLQSSQVISQSVADNLARFNIFEGSKTITIVRSSENIYHYNEIENCYYIVKKKEGNPGNSSLPSAVSPSQPVFLLYISPSNYTNFDQPQYLVQGPATYPLASLHHQINAPNINSSTTLPMNLGNLPVVIWDWEDRTEYREYSRDVCQIIERAFQNNEPEVILNNLRPGVSYKIVFANNNFLQYNMNTGYSLRVRRR